MTPALDRLAARQLGLITAGQLQALGLNRRQVSWKVANGLLILVRRRVYRVVGAPTSWEQAVMAAILAAGADAVASHATAAVIWDLKYSDRARAGLHVTAPRQLRIQGIIGHHYRLAPAERAVCGGIAVTTPERTLIDLAAILAPARLGECLDDALRRRLVNLDRLRRVAHAVNTGGGRRLLAPLHQVLADRPGSFRPGDSDWEQEMDRQWDRLGLPTAHRHFRVTARGSTYILDRAIPDLRVGIEWNGYQTHGTRSGFDRDSDRSADLTAEGWHIIGFTSRSTPERITRAVLRLVDDRRSWKTATTSRTGGTSPTSRTG